jgi:GGDEF domain-containing protein
MIGRLNPRLFVALAPGLVLGVIAIVMADQVEPASTRFILQFLAIGSIADMSWRVGAAALGGTITRAHGLPERLKLVTSDHRRTTFDHETGLHSEWYFRLRVDEEIARARRYSQPFSLIMVAATSRKVLDVVRITMKQWLREVDYAGDLGDVLALCLPNTDRASAEAVVQRLTSLVEGVHVSLAEYPVDGATLAALLGEEDSRQNGLRATVA